MGDERSLFSGQADFFSRAGDGALQIPALRPLLSIRNTRIYFPPFVIVGAFF